MPSPRFTMVALLVDEPWRTNVGACMGLVGDPDANTVLVTAG